MCNLPTGAGAARGICQAGTCISTPTTSVSTPVPNQTTTKTSFLVFSDVTTKAIETSATVALGATAATTVATTIVASTAGAGGHAGASAFEALGGAGVDPFTTFFFLQNVAMTKYVRTRDPRINFS